MDTLDALRCPCGCGQFIDDAHDPATEGRWQVHVQECYADKTKREFRKDHADEVEGKLLWVELLPEGKSPSDPLAFNPERAKAEFEALQKRHGVG